MSYAIPVSLEELQLVKEKQLELIIKRGKIITLTEISNEIVRKGLPLVD